MLAIYEHLIRIASTVQLAFGHDDLRDGFGYWLLPHLGNLRGKTTRCDRRWSAISGAWLGGNVGALPSLARSQDVETGNFGRLLHCSFLRCMGRLFSDLQLLAITGIANPTLNRTAAGELVSYSGGTVRRCRLVWRWAA